MLVAGHPGVLVGMQMVGAAYLAWLAYNAVQESRQGSELTAQATGQHWFRRGFVVNLANPKIALFFLAFLPQFLGTATSPALQSQSLLVSVIATSMWRVWIWSASSSQAIASAAWAVSRMCLRMSGLCLE